MQDLAAGGIDIVTCSVPEARAHDRGRQGAEPRRSWRKRAIRNSPNVPTLQEAMGIDYDIGAWRGFAGPKGLPQPIASKLTAALKKVYDSKEYKDFMSSRGFGVIWGDAERYAAFMDESDKKMGEAMKAAGLAKT